MVGKKFKVYSFMNEKEMEKQWNRNGFVTTRFWTSLKSPKTRFSEFVSFPLLTKGENVWKLLF